MHLQVETNANKEIKCIDMMVETKHERHTMALKTHYLQYESY